MHSEIEDRAYFYRDVVPRDHILGRHVHCHRAQIHADHFFDDGDNISDARPARRNHAPEAKDHGSIVFFKNLDAADQKYRGDDERGARGS